MTSANNKRIAKNTLLLYCRQLVSLGMSLYTSRLILQILGETDFGVYAAVGGVTSLLSVIITAMSSSTQRFVAYELGRKNNDGVCDVFSTSNQIHVLLSAIVLLIGETVGLWFVYNHLNVEASKLPVALIVYQISIVSCILAVISVPYNALIIAHEYMGAFALFTIADTVLKFIGVLLIPFIPINHLIAYALLMCLVQLLSRILMWWYCGSRFKTVRYRHKFQPVLFRQMFGIAGWNSMVSIAQTIYLQGSVLTLNVFFGPIINAAYSVAMQAYSGLRQFCSSFQSASSPQIVKYYAAGELNEMHRLLQFVCKFSFFLLFFLTLPFVLTAPQVIGFWLVKVPPYAPIFFVWMVIYAYFDIFTYPLDVAAQASGRLARYCTFCSFLTIIILPVAYILFKVGFPPEAIVCTAVVFSLIGCITRIVLLSRLIGINVVAFFRNSIGLCMLTGIASAVIPVACVVLLPDIAGRFFVIVAVSILFSSAGIWFIGFRQNERKAIVEKASLFINKFKH